MKYFVLADTLGTIVATGACSADDLAKQAHSGLVVAEISAEQRSAISGDLAEWRLVDGELVPAS